MALANASNTTAQPFYDPAMQDALRQRELQSNYGLATLGRGQTRLDQDRLLMHDFMGRQFGRDTESMQGNLGGRGVNAGGVYTGQMAQLAQDQQYQKNKAELEFARAGEDISAGIGQIKRGDATFGAETALSGSRNAYERALAALQRSF